MSVRTHKRGAFSLVELVIVIVIIGIIAAIAIPRVSRGSRGAGESSLASNLSVLRNAIELYASEHNGDYPGAKARAGGGVVGNTAADFTEQLTRYTDAVGKTSLTRDPANGIVYGPYLRKGIPPVPVGPVAIRGSTAVVIDTTNPAPVATEADGGWVYNPTTGDIIANTNDPNENGDKTYDQY